MNNLRKAAQQALDALEEPTGKVNVIKTWNERCETHPDHQTGMVSNLMIQARMQEEIDELRAALYTAPPQRKPLAKCNYPDCVDNGPYGKCIRWLLGECEKSEGWER